MQASKFPVETWAACCSTEGASSVHCPRAKPAPALGTPVLSKALLTDHLQEPRGALGRVPSGFKGQLGDLGLVTGCFFFLQMDT